LYTSVFCSFCPGADSLIQNVMLVQHPELIPVSYHVWEGSPILHDPFEQFHGKDIVNYLETGFVLTPGMNFDRYYMRCNFLQMLDSFALRYQYAPETPVELVILSKTYNASTRLLNVTVKAKTYQTLSGLFKINFVITENNRIYPQVNGGDNYVHHWIARDLVNGAKGDTLINEAWFSGYEITKSFSTVIDTGWVAGNCDFIFYIYRKGLEDTLLIHNDIYQSFKGSVTGSNGILNAGQNVTGYSLFQNYPNPFNPVTSIKFSIPKNENISLKVFDILGKEVSSVYNGYLKAGTYNADFNASELSSGIYFYKLETKNFVDVKKMILVK